MAIDYNERIPNNVHLSDDRRLQRALEAWQPHFLDWWKELGPEGFQAKDVFLRTAVSVDAKGWASYGMVKMPDYRWGIFLNDPQPDRKIGFGDFYRPARVAGDSRRIPRHPAPPHRDARRHRARIGRAAAPPRPDLPLAL